MIVLPKIKLLSSFTHHHVVPKLYERQQRRYFAKLPYNESKWCPMHGQKLMRLSKWHNFHFWVNYPFKSKFLSWNSGWRSPIGLTQADIMTPVFTWHSWACCSMFKYSASACYSSCSALEPSTLPSSTCIDLLWGDFMYVIYGGYFICVIYVQYLSHLTFLPPLNFSRSLCSCGKRWLLFRIGTCDNGW